VAPGDYGPRVLPCLPGTVPGGQWEVAVSKYNANAYRNGEHIGPGPWLAVVQESQLGLTRATFTEWWAGGESEEYTHMRVIHHLDESVSVVGKTEHGEREIAAAIERLKAGTGALRSQTLWNAPG
jgi:hypothetical protein